jgi:hypothetical protein
MCNDTSFGLTIPGRSCPVGRYISAGCQLCPQGTFGFGNSSSCFSCPSGKYGPYNGSSVCFDCKPHHFQNLTGMSACIECDQGYYNRNYGAKSIFDCLPQYCSSKSYVDPSGVQQFVYIESRGPKRFFRAQRECEDNYHNGVIFNPLSDADAKLISNFNLSSNQYWIGTYAREHHTEMWT